VLPVHWLAIDVVGSVAEVGPSLANVIPDLSHFFGVVDVRVVDSLRFFLGLLVHLAGFLGVGDACQHTVAVDWVFSGLHFGRDAVHSVFVLRYVLFAHVFEKYKFLLSESQQLFLVVHVFVDGYVQDIVVLADILILWLRLGFAFVVAGQGVRAEKDGYFVHVVHFVDVYVCHFSFLVTAGTFLHGQKHALVDIKTQHKKSFFFTFFRGGWQVSCQQGHLSKVFYCIITRPARGVFHIILPINTTNTFSKIPHERR